MTLNFIYFHVASKFSNILKIVVKNEFINKLSIRMPF
jgi:hypothetical protein